MTSSAGPALPTGRLTFLFSDVEGSTRLLQACGRDVFGALMADHHGIVRQSLRDAGGVEVSTEGDSFFAVFEDPSAAVRASIAIQRGLAQHPWPEGRDVRVRIGLHTGEASLGGDSYVGLDVNRAARIGAAGHGGMTLLSDVTRRSVERSLPADVHLRDLGLHRLKDLDDPERLVQLVVDGLPDDLPPPRTLERPLELPKPLTSFVGREPELAAGLRSLEHARLVTLIGPGGTGKTRLAIEIARRAAGSFPEGAWFVDLSPVADPVLVPAAIATALRVRESPRRTTSDGIIDHLRDRSLLLVLDNFEQVLPAREIVGRILAEAAGIRVLVTSREILHLSGEHELPVPPLGLPEERDGAEAPPAEAIDLFAERARAVRADFAITPANAGHVAAIVRRLDGLPLAIELAAARTRVLAPAELLGRLDRSLAVISAEGPGPDRQRTLAGAIAWSHDLLGEAERRMFARLGVFVSGASLEAIEAVCVDDASRSDDAIDLVTALVERSLVRRVEVGDSSRFTMLDTIRTFARERLVELPDREAVEARHTAYYLALARSAEPELGGARGRELLDRLELDHDDLRAVLRRSIDQGPIETGLGLAGALWRFWQQRSHLREGRRWLAELLAVPGAEEPTAARADALTAEAGLRYWQGELERTRELYEEVLAIREQLGDERGTAWALHDLGFSQLGDPSGARVTFETAIERFRRIDDRAGIASAAGAIGYVSVTLGDHARAETAIAEALALNEELGQANRAIDNHSGLGQLARAQGRLREAEAHYRRGLLLVRETGDATRPAMLLEELAAVVFDDGRPEVAARMLGAVDGLRERLGGGLSRNIMLTEELEEGIRTALGEAGFDAARAAGRTLDLERAIAFALGELDADAATSAERHA